MSTNDLKFWAKVYKTETCWLWTGATDQRGYGFVNRNYKHIRAHRYAWTLENGPIPTDLQVLHSCDNPACVRPSHLWLGTNADNMWDKAKKGRASTCGRTYKVKYDAANPLS